MRRWQLLIVLGSATAALAVGLGAQAQAEEVDLLAWIGNALSAFT
ncbi:MAG TPA: hypothetical protein VIE16_13285 [Phenylobacterium sp.]|jgi:hypothetical protein